MGAIHIFGTFLIISHAGRILKVCRWIYVSKRNEPNIPHRYRATMSANLQPPKSSHPTTPRQPS